MTEKITRENYFEKRRELVEANTNLVGVILSEDEKRLDAKLTALKKQFEDDCGGDVPYDVPVLSDERIWESGLYRFCLRLPKGADLHVHFLAELPIRELIEVLRERDDVFINLASGEYELACADEGRNVPAGFVRVRAALEEGLVTEEQLAKCWTVLGAAEGEDIWDYFERLFVKLSALGKKPDFVRAYYDRAFRYYCSRNIMHLEIHALLVGDRDKCLERISAVRDAYYAVKEEYPELCVSLIGAGLKYKKFSIESAQESFMNAVYLREKLKDCSDAGHESEFVIGFDLVNEEDASRPLKEFAPMLLEAAEKYPGMGLYMHGGESLDAESDNLMDAYLLGASRVGHGMNLYRYPDLLRRYTESEICLEVCVISNQTLGYTKDVRIHPATEFLRRGVAVSLCSDDPAYQEHESLTDDFFAAIVGWNLGLADIKQLCINSIMYSGVDAFQKTKMMRAFREKWYLFVAEMLREE